MSATSSALTGKSRRERSVCGTTPQRPGATTRPATGSSSPVSARKSVVLPPPFGPRTAARSPAPDGERHVAQDGAGAVGERHALARDGDVRGRRTGRAAGPPGRVGRVGLRPAHRAAIRHPRAPPVKPRSIASALWISLATYVAPSEPFGPSESP